MEYNHHIFETFLSPLTSTHTSDAEPHFEILGLKHAVFVKDSLSAQPVGNMKSAYIAAIKLSEKEQRKQVAVRDIDQKVNVELK